MALKMADPECPFTGNDGTRTLPKSSAPASINAPPLKRHKPVGPPMPEILRWNKEEMLDNMEVLVRFGGAFAISIGCTRYLSETGPQSSVADALASACIRVAVATGIALVHAVLLPPSDGHTSSVETARRLLQSSLCVRATKDTKEDGAYRFSPLSTLRLLIAGLCWLCWCASLACTLALQRRTDVAMSLAVSVPVSVLVYRVLREWAETTKPARLVPYQEHEAFTEGPVRTARDLACVVVAIAFMWILYVCTDDRFILGGALGLSSALAPAGLAWVHNTMRANEGKGGHHSTAVVQTTTAVLCASVCVAAISATVFSMRGGHTYLPPGLGLSRLLWECVAGMVLYLFTLATCSVTTKSCGGPGSTSAMVAIFFGFTIAYLWSTAVYLYAEQPVGLCEGAGGRIAQALKPFEGTGGGYWIVQWCVNNVFKAATNPVRTFAVSGIALVLLQCRWQETKYFAELSMFLFHAKQKKRHEKMVQAAMEAGRSVNALDRDVELRMNASYQMLMLTMWTLPLTLLAIPFLHLIRLLVAIGNFVGPFHQRLHAFRTVVIPGVVHGVSYYVAPNPDIRPGIVYCNIGHLDNNDISMRGDNMEVSTTTVDVLTAYSSSSEKSRADGYVGNIACIFPYRIVTPKPGGGVTVRRKIRHFNFSAWTTAAAAHKFNKDSLAHLRIVSNYHNKRLNSFSALIGGMKPMSPIKYHNRCRRCRRTTYNYPEVTVCRNCDAPLPVMSLF